MTVLAKRAIACSGWRWLPGMLTLDGLRLGGVSHPPSDAWSCVTAAGEPADRQLQGSLPDLADPGTLGCLLHLVRGAWGCPVEVRSLGGRFTVVARDWSGLSSVSEGKALVESLEDASCET